MSRRRVFNMLSAMSLAVCVVVTVLWVRSWSVSDHVQWRRAGNGRVEEWRLRFADGRVGLSGELLWAPNSASGNDVSWGMGLPNTVPATWRGWTAFPAGT